MPDHSALSRGYRQLVAHRSVFQCSIVAAKGRDTTKAARARWRVSDNTLVLLVV